MFREGVDVTAIIQSSAPTSPGKIHLDASVDSGSDIGTDRQNADNDPGSSGEPMGEVASQSMGRIEEHMPNMTALITLLEILTLEKSSLNYRELILNKDWDLHTPVAPLVTSLRKAIVISPSGTLKSRSFRRSETYTMWLSDTPNPKSSERVMNETLREPNEHLQSKLHI